MIRRIVGWLRVAAPPYWALLLLLPVLGYEAAYLWLQWRGAVPQAAERLLKTRDGFLVIFAIALGGWRAWNFHPLFRNDYRDWLRLTPWTSRMPLPLGPIHLVPQDALWLALALALWHDPQLSRLYPPLWFAFAYLSVICVSCWPTGSITLGYLLAFGLGEVVRQSPAPLAALTMAGWLYLAAWIGLRLMLARFPWQLSWYWNCRSLQAIVDEAKWRTFGWPLDQLQGRWDDPEVSLVHGTLLSLLAGWWHFCLLSLVIPQARERLMLFAMWGIACCCIVMRVGGYLTNYRPPINAWGRIFTLRWIVPRYDHILATPVFIYFAASYAPHILAAWKVPAEWGASATVSLVMMLALNMPPSFKRWRLTGFHRVVAGSGNRQEFEQI